MISKYEIGDVVLLSGTITGVEQDSSGEITYRIREYTVPVGETAIVARIEEPWRLQKERN